MLFLCCFGLVSPQFVVLVWFPLNFMVMVWFAPYVNILCSCDSSSKCCLYFSSLFVSGKSTTLLQLHVDLQIPRFGCRLEYPANGETPTVTKLGQIDGKELGIT